MNLFPINQPTLALSISEDTLRVVKVKQFWRTITLQHVNSVPLPAGLIRLSSAKPNIENMDTFIEQLRILADPLKKPASIAISLPDLCARTSMFDFSTFPAKVSEQTALLNWRFQQDLKLDTSQSRLAFGGYIPTSLSKGSKHENPENTWVLGTAIRNEIVEQYEHACLDVNLMPVSVSIAGLDIFDLYQSTMEDVLEAEGRHRATSSSGAMFLFISHWGFTFFAFHDGCPRFVRTKAIAIRPDSNLADEDSALSGSDIHATPFTHEEKRAEQELKSQETHNHNGSSSPYSSSTATKVEKEILATLQYFLETFPHNDMTSSPEHLFVVSDLEHGHLLLPTSEHIQQTAKISGLRDSDIQVTHLSPSTHFNNRNACLIQESNIWSALSGYASLRVA
jgi:hypothetical protein